MALHLAGTLLASSGTAAICSSGLLTHPATRPWIHVLYRLLEPATAPLEPLLLAAGVRRDHPHRHCHCGEPSREAPPPPPLLPLL